MGRFVSGAQIGNTPRRLSIRLLASNPSVPIPSWARVAYITGCGGGEGGASATNGGDGACSALRHPLLIPAGAASMGVVIGAGGVAPGGAGGDTSIAIDGVNALRLRGGQGGDISPEIWDASQNQWRSFIRIATVRNDTSQVYGLTLLPSSANDGSRGGSSMFGANGGGFGSGGGVGRPGAPGFLLIEFEESL